MGKRGILITLIILLAVSLVFIITGVLFEQKFLPITGAFWSGVWVSQISMATRLDSEPKESEEFKELIEKPKYKLIDITNGSHRIIRDSISFKDAVDYLYSLGCDDIQADFDLETGKVSIMICCSGSIKTAVYKIEEEKLK